METIIYNLDIILNSEQSKLLNSLAGHINRTSKELLSDLTLGKATWKELENLNEIHEYTSNPNAKRYSMEEAEEYLKTGIFPI